MKRREALKNLGLATGLFVASPTITSLLQSCTSNTKIWTPEFLSADQGIVLQKLVDIILPKTDHLPSATELNVPEFIDKYFNEILLTEDQEYVKTAFANMVTQLKPHPDTPIEDVTEATYKLYLDQYMPITGYIDEEREATPKALGFTKSEFLNHLKWMAINAFLNTESIGENVLAYDPVPTQYFCGNINNLTGGKSYSL